MLGADRPAQFSSDGIEAGGDRHALGARLVADPIRQIARHFGPVVDHADQPERVSSLVDSSMLFGMLTRQSHALPMLPPGADRARWKAYDRVILQLGNCYLG